MSQPVYPGDPDRAEDSAAPAPPPQPQEEPRYGVRLPPDQIPPTAAPNPYGQATPPIYGGQAQPPYQAAPPTYGGQPQHPYQAQSPYGVPHAQPRNAAGNWSLALGIASIALFCFSWVASLVGAAAIVTGIVSVNNGKNGLATNARLGKVGIITGAIGVVLGIAMFVLLSWFLTTPEGQEFMRQYGNF